MREMPYKRPIKGAQKMRIFESLGCRKANENRFEKYLADILIII